MLIPCAFLTFKSSSYWSVDEWVNECLPLFQLGQIYVCDLSVSCEDTAEVWGVERLAACLTCICCLKVIKEDLVSWQWWVSYHSGFIRVVSQGRWRLRALLDLDLWNNCACQIKSCHIPSCTFAFTWNLALQLPQAIVSYTRRSFACQSGSASSLKSLTISENRCHAILWKNLLFR